MGDGDGWRFLERLAQATGEEAPTHFRCAFHGVVLPGDEYEKHCNEQHYGAQIAVQMLTLKEGEDG